MIGFAAPAFADTTCTGDICVVNQSVETAAGLVTVTVGAGNVVTVQLAPAVPRTLVVGVPAALVPLIPIAGCPGGCSRTSIETSAGVVNVDTFQVPPGPPAFQGLQVIAVISIHPPSPCRVRTVGTTVTFTPIGYHG
jgi:hypothetical protein